MASIIRTAFGFIFIALLASVFAVSFAAIVYKGDLSPYLDRGIALTLLGALSAAVTGAFALSYRGSILAPQDVPAILLAGSASTFVAANNLSGEVLFATVACLVAVASLATGLASALVGHYKLAFIARFVPYPVLAGFLAATGLLLVIGGLDVSLGRTEIDTVQAAFSQEALLKWAPVLAASVAMIIATRRIHHDLTLPTALVTVTLGFYVLFWAVGLSMDEARAGGFLVGPFSRDGFLTDISPAIVGKADWQAIATQVPVIITVVATCLLGVTLNASGLELELETDFDISQEVKGMGLGNLVSSLVGGMPSYHILGESVLAHRFGLRGSTPGVAAAAGCLILLVFGAGFLSGLPIGLFATVLVFLGADLLYTWVWMQRHKFTWLDYGIVIIIPLVAVSFGFLSAIVVGLLIASGIFIITYSKLDVIRSQTDLATRRSSVERPDHELRLLSDRGAGVAIVELRGYLFFGSANTLRERLQTLQAKETGKIHAIMLDFAHVTGVDVSTLRSLERIAQDCAAHHVQLTLTRLDDATRESLRDRLQALGTGFAETLDDALEQAEGDIIAANTKGTPDTDHGHVATLLEDAAFADLVEAVDLEPGETLISHGSTSRDLYYLRSGYLLVSIPTAQGRASVVAKIQAGAIVGEMAFYTGSGRTADILAGSKATLTRVDMDRFGDIERDAPALATQFHKYLAENLARRLTRTSLLLRDLGV